MVYVEKFDQIAYSYSDDIPDWQWLDSYGPDHQNGRSYKLDDPLTDTFRTYHSHFSYRRDERKRYNIRIKTPSQGLTRR